ncbi:MAG: pH regulation protein F [Desulfuromonas sp.]|nr:MAG: pH regulation protein F [Desulfuromonas sp.]
MDQFLLAGSIALTLLVIPTLYRMIVGPTILDRILGGNMIGTKTTVLLLFIGALYDDIGMFVDIAIAYALLNFIATLAATKFFLRRRRLFFKDEITASEQEGRS